MKKSQFPFLFILFSFLTILSASAQELTVTKMEPLPFDTYASVHKRVDNNEVPCAVVRVSLPLDGATFSGNVVGNVVRDVSDYLVFMPAGSKKFWVKHPNYHELEIFFGDYGIDRLESLATYRVTVNVPSTPASQSKQTLTIKVTPSDAVVLIDDEMVESSSVELPVGSHKYNVAAKGYESQSGTVDISDTHPAKLVVELDRKAASSQGSVQTAVSQQPQPVQQPAETTHPVLPVQQPALAVPQPAVSSPAASGGAQTFTVNGVSFTMLPVEGGTFTMGATEEMAFPFKDEKPTHQVTLSSYYMGETEVTQALWTAVMGSNPSHFKGDDLPVETVSWNDCQTFLTKLNALTGRTFRLPTEAEWEYAARGGSKSGGTQFSGSSNLDEVAWYNGNSGSKTHAVKTKKANELGLYDMSGNVWEWCQDRYGKYSRRAQMNPTGPIGGSTRVIRGGEWHFEACHCRSSFRLNIPPGNGSSYLGFRLALSE